VDWRNGLVMYQSYTQTLRVNFTPATPTWTAVQSSYTGVVNIDPILFTDSVSGRTYAGGLDGACSILAYTDNDGAAWTPMTNNCALPAYDHETVGGGAWHAPAPQQAVFPRAVYYCAQAEVEVCAVSHDGGLSFAPGVPISAMCRGLVGHVKVAPDGTVYVPAQRCGGRQGVVVSEDNGLTWTTRTLRDASIPAYGFDPSVGISTNGVVYAGWQAQDGAQMVSVSHDKGVSWSVPRDVGAVHGLQATTFSSVVSGDDDRAAVAFLGTKGGTGNPFVAGYRGSWDLYVAFTYDGGVTWTTVKATTDPVQRGWICSSGLNCNGGRNLLDFMDAAIDAQGRVLVGYADGCITTCTTSATLVQSSSQKATIARQSSGSTLFAAYDPVGASPPSAPDLSVDPASGQVALSWPTPATFGSAVTGYQVWRGTSPGASARYVTVAASANGYVDTGVTSNTTYWYEVTAQSAAGESGKSGQFAATPRTGSAPGTPANFTVDPPTALVNNAAGLQWSVPDGGTYGVHEYKVYRGTAPGALQLYGRTTIQQYTDASAMDGVTYYYQVSAVSDAGESPRTVEVSIVG
jgi:hypothetical protein